MLVPDFNDRDKSLLEKVVEGTGTAKKKVLDYFRSALLIGLVAYEQNPHKPKSYIPNLLLTVFNSLDTCGHINGNKYKEQISYLSMSFPHNIY